MCYNVLYLQCFLLFESKVSDELCYIFLDINPEIMITIIIMMITIIIMMIMIIIIIITIIK